MVFKENVRTLSHEQHPVIQAKFAVLQGRRAQLLKQLSDIEGNFLGFGTAEEERQARKKYAALLFGVIMKAKLPVMQYLSDAVGKALRDTSEPNFTQSLQVLECVRKVA